MDNNWDMHAQQQQQARQQQPYARSQSMSIPASQFSNSSQQQYPPGDYGQYQLDRRYQQGHASPIPPLQVNPSSFSHSEAQNLPSSSLQGQPLPRSDRQRTQSVALTSIGQREHGYASSSAYPRVAHRGATTGSNYTSEANVPISRHAHPGTGQWGHYPEHRPHPTELRVPSISSVRTGYPVPTREMTLPPVEEVQPRPKPHVCEQCGAAFSRAHDLKRHIETHKGDRPHKCPTCTKAFSRKDALQRHQSMAQCGVDPQEMYQ